MVSCVTDFFITCRKLQNKKQSLSDFQIILIPRYLLKRHPSIYKVEEIKKDLRNSKNYLGKNSKVTHIKCQTTQVLSE
jgi:hypothetical protein